MTDRTMPELFACTRLSARLTVHACGSRYLRVRASTPGQQAYDSACVQCPIGAHHATHGTLCPDATAQAPATTTTTVAIQPTQTPATTTTEETTMGAPSEYTDEQKREAVRRVLINNKSQSELAKELGVTTTTIRNWLKRWGKDVASDAMSAAAAGGDVAGDAVEAKRQSPPKSSGSAKGRKPKGVERDAKPSKTEAPSPLPSPDLLAVLDRDALGRLGAELSYAVVDIADKRARSAVADAAWLLTQASRG